MNKFAFERTLVCSLKYNTDVSRMNYTEKDVFAEQATTEVLFCGDDDGARRRFDHLVADVLQRHQVNPKEFDFMIDADRTKLFCQECGTVTQFFITKAKIVLTSEEEQMVRFGSERLSELTDLRELFYEYEDKLCPYDDNECEDIIDIFEDMLDGNDYYWDQYWQTMRDAIEEYDRQKASKYHDSKRSANNGRS